MLDGCCGAAQAALPTADVRSMELVMGESVARPRLLIVLMLVFAVAALVLAAIGTYSVLSYAVAQRTREIGARMALGAQTGQVLAMVLGQEACLTSLGLFLGGGGALALRRVLAGLLYGVAPSDPVVFTAVATLLALSRSLPANLPARRASRVDPLRLSITGERPHRRLRRMASRSLRARSSARSRVAAAARRRTGAPPSAPSWAPMCSRRA